MPLNENYGFWTDSQVTLSPMEYESVQATDFERTWLEIETKFASSARDA
jgi:hypothetical protein